MLKWSQVDDTKWTASNEDYVFWIKHENEKYILSQYKWIKNRGGTEGPISENEYDELGLAKGAATILSQYSSYSHGQNIESEVINRAIDQLNVKDYVKPLHDDIAKEIEKIDSMPDVDPCEVSDEACEVLSDVKEKMFERAKKKKLYSPKTEIKIILSGAEEELLKERADNLAMDIPAYLKFVGLNAKIDLTMFMDEIKSLYNHYYGKDNDE